MTEPRQQAAAATASGNARSTPRVAPVDFLIIGAMRAGTTALHEILSRHPGISMSRDKETDYFVAEKNWSRGPDWYRGQFDPSRGLWGEASPNYTKGRDFAGVPERVALHAPEARLIYLLRDPVRRAVSQYAHGWNMGTMGLRPEDLPGSDRYDSMIDTSRYGCQLTLWRAHFAEDRILLVDFDALLADPQAQLARILSHIGAEPMQIDAVESHNRAEQLSRVPTPLLRLAWGPMRPLLTAVLGQRSRAYLRRLVARGPGRTPPPFPDSVLARMRDDLADDAALLRRMTGMEFAHWSV